MGGDPWRNVGEMMGGVAVIGGPASALVAGVHAPVTPTPETAGMEHGAIRHDMGAMGDTVRTRKPGMAHGKKHTMPAMRWIRLIKASPGAAFGGSGFSLGHSNALR